MHWGWKCIAPIELPHAKSGDAPKGVLLGLGGGVNAFVCGVSCLQSVKIHKCLLRLHSFQCIGGRSVPTPLSWHTLGRAMHQKAHHLALAEAWMHCLMAYHVGKVWKSVNVCLNCTVFNILRVEVYCPHWVGARWAGRCAKRRVAWPCQRRECIFLHRITLAGCENPQRMD